MADNYIVSNTPIDAEVYDVTIIKGDKGDKGDLGPTPVFSIGEVTTLEYDQPASATISGTAEQPVLNLGIPVGKDAYTQAAEGGYTGGEAEFNSDLANFKTYATTAESAKGSAETAATNAAASASAAAASATAAAGSASDAADDADRAEQAESDASGYATNAAASASSAASSAGTATTKAGEAAQSATAASQSASSASSSATAASGSASEAAGSATNASNSATSAATSATAANTAKTAAETAQGKAEDAQDAAETAASSVSASAAQIATNTSDIADLKSAITYKADLPTAREVLSYEPQLSKLINSYGVVIPLANTDNNYRVTSYIPVDGGKKYYINAFATTYGTAYSLYAFYDSNYSPILWVNARSTDDKFTGEVYAPTTATYMVVAYTLARFGGKDPSQYLITEQPVDLSEVYALNGNYEYKTNSAESTLTTGKLIYVNTGVISSVGDNKWAILDIISVQGGEEYIINATMMYNNGVIAIYDSTDKAIDVINATEGTQVGDNKYQFDSFHYKIPYGATKMVVGVYTVYPYSVNKIVGYELIAKTRKWIGKKWVVVGDSLTEHNGRTTKNYHDYISEATGITVVNMGVSGSGYRNATSAGNKAFYQRISSVPTDADVVTIFGSFNDGISDIGTADDTGTETLGGCVNTTIDNLYAVFPTVQLGIVSPTPWNYANPYTHPAANAYADLLEAICKKRSIPFLNLYYESNLRPWDSTFRTLAYSKDDGNGVHPDETGHKLIASRFEGFLDSLLLD